MPFKWCSLSILLKSLIVIKYQNIFAEEDEDGYLKPSTHETLSNENDDLVDESGYLRMSGQPVQQVENKDVVQPEENNENNSLLDENGYLRLDGQPIQLSENEKGSLDGDDLREEPKYSEIRDASKLDKNDYFCFTLFAFGLKWLFLLHVTQICR